MRKKIICIMGKSGVGKSTLISDFFEKYQNEFNLNIVKSYTSRKVRKNDPNDKNTHIFVSIEKFKEDIKSKKIISCYYSVDNNYYNWVTNECFKGKWNLFAIDPLACSKLIKESKKYDIFPVYLSLDDNIRFQRLKKRDNITKLQEEKELSEQILLENNIEFKRILMKEDREENVIQFFQLLKKFEL